MQNLKTSKYRQCYSCGYVFLAENDKLASNILCVDCVNDMSPEIVSECCELNVKRWNDPTLSLTTT